MRSTTKNTLGTLSLLLLTSSLVASTGGNRPGGNSGDPTDLGDGQVIDQTQPESRPSLGTGGNANDLGNGSTPTGGGVTAPVPDYLEAAGDAGQFDLGSGADTAAAQTAPGTGIGAGNDANDFSDGSGGGDTGPGQMTRDQLGQAGNPDDFGSGGAAPVYQDCNENGVPDNLEIDADPALDLNYNGRLDRCDARAADVDGNGQINVLDLIQVILRWGECEGCSEDIDANNTVDVNDLTALIELWN